MNDTTRTGGNVTAPDHPKLKRLFRLQWEPAQQASVLLYPEGMVKLNQSAAEILKRCDGTRSFDALVADLEQAFDTAGLAPEIRAFVEHAHTRGWLE
ncbi:pyrroloquinoline quinone biosynthesis peptide chaperone PqqD [Paraburkholderia phosphatilytica]|uniref:pyrroloquinoline quinone biosynthesis peptide chaperone PqqD n=1 Tax=Paraburkholderia phosphatilytica TaxID=2282883 RepID=UPI000E4BA752|nr:pyrroloquinoline quinone biosynthesis peptide chaperone PqqD [Paraburkholderia phosphatilytica]